MIQAGKKEAQLFTTKHAFDLLRACFCSEHVHSKENFAIRRRCFANQADEHGIVVYLTALAMRRQIDDASLAHQADELLAVVVRSQIDAAWLQRPFEVIFDCFSGIFRGPMHIFDRKSRPSLLSQPSIAFTVKTGE